MSDTGCILESYKFKLGFARLNTPSVSCSHIISLVVIVTLINILIWTPVQ